MLKGIIFDLDGVLTDTAEFHYRAWKELGEKLGISFDRNFNENLKGISRMDSLERILEYGGKAEAFTAEEKAAFAEEKNNRYKELIKKITPKDILPGMKNFIADCQSRHLRLALASASKNAPVILEQLGLENAFDSIVDPATLQKGKPDPEIFLKGAELLGMRPEECAGIEDAEAGIEAIHAAGMLSVGVGSPQSMKQADLFVEKTEDLQLDEIIRAFNIKYSESK